DGLRAAVKLEPFGADRRTPVGHGLKPFDIERGRSYPPLSVEGRAAEDRRGGKGHLAERALLLPAQLAAVVRAIDHMIEPPGLGDGPEARHLKARLVVIARIADRELLRRDRDAVGKAGRIERLVADLISFGN